MTSERRRSDASERYADLSNFAVEGIGASGEADLRDGLRLSGSNLAIVLVPSLMRAREANAKDDFVGRQIHLLVAGVEVRVGNCSHTAYGSEFQFGIVHEQRWRRI